MKAAGSRRGQSLMRTLQPDHLRPPTLWAGRRRITDGGWRVTDGGWRVPAGVWRGPPPIRPSLRRSPTGPLPSAFSFSRTESVAVRDSLGRDSLGSPSPTHRDRALPVGDDRASPPHRLQGSGSQSPEGDHGFSFPRQTSSPFPRRKSSHLTPPTSPRSGAQGSLPRGSLPRPRGSMDQGETPLRKLTQPLLTVSTPSASFCVECILKGDDPISKVCGQGRRGQGRIGRGVTPSPTAGGGGFVAL